MVHQRALRLALARVRRHAGEFPFGNGEQAVERRPELVLRRDKTSCQGNVRALCGPLWNGQTAALLAALRLELRAAHRRLAVATRAPTNANASADAS